MIWAGNTEWTNVILDQLQRLAFLDLVDLEAQVQSLNKYALKGHQLR